MSIVFGFRDEYESDIEVEVEEHAGVPEIQKATEEQKAREILADINGNIDQDDDRFVLQPGGKYICWHVGQPFITLDDDFSVEELEAIVWWMKNKGR
jgi:hypothetical protein